MILPNTSTSNIDSWITIVFLLNGSRWEHMDWMAHISPKPTSTHGPTTSYPHMNKRRGPTPKGGEAPHVMGVSHPILRIKPDIHYM
jgi:hypothetical protein